MLDRIQHFVQPSSIRHDSFPHRAAESCHPDKEDQPAVFEPESVCRPTHTFLTRTSDVLYMLRASPEDPVACRGATATALSLVDGERLMRLRGTSVLLCSARSPHRLTPHSCPGRAAPMRLRHNDAGHAEPLALPCGALDAELQTAT